MLPNGKSANNFDVLRIAFALIVTFLHVYEVPGGNSEKLLWRPGEMAVGMFFAISGYLICQSWLRKPDLIAFLQKRVSRIYPGFIACSLICGLLIAPWISSPDFWRQFNLSNFIASILCLQQPDVPRLIVNAPCPQINLSMWSIVFEFGCYLVVAILGIFSLLRRPVLVIGLITALICNALYALNIWHDDGQPHWWGTAKAYSMCLSYFLSGSVFLSYAEKIPLKGRYALVALAILLAAIPAGLYSVLLPIFGVYIMFYLALGLPVNVKLKHDLSYGIYLWNWPVLQAILFAWPPTHNPWLMLVVGLPITVIMAALSWFLVERPFLMKRSRQSQPITAAA